MKDVSARMIKTYELTKHGYDFMGYTFNKVTELSFHHLIVARKDCSILGVEHEGYVDWNGAILKQNTSHDYLHAIERVDREIFMEISRAMVRENRLGRLDIKEIKRIRDLLVYFEREHLDDLTNKGNRLIKHKYLTQRIEF